MMEPELHQLKDKKDDILEFINQALEAAGLSVDVKSLSLRIKRAPVCPPGHSPVWEAVQDPDGTVTYQWVCRPS